MSATSTRAEAEAALALFCERWPECFFMVQERRKPLKIGIHRDLLDGSIDPKTLSLALRIYTRNEGYLRAVILGAVRIDLDGKEAGVVAENDVLNARQSLAGIKKAAQKRRAEKPPPPEEKPPPQRDGLATLREAAAKRRTIA